MGNRISGIEHSKICTRLEISEPTRDGLRQKFTGKKNKQNLKAWLLLYRNYVITHVLMPPSVAPERVGFYQHSLRKIACCDISYLGEATKPREKWYTARGRSPMYNSTSSKKFGGVWSVSANKRLHVCTRKLPTTSMPRFFSQRSPDSRLFRTGNPGYFALSSSGQSHFCRERCSIVHIIGILVKQ